MWWWWSSQGTALFLIDVVGQRRAERYERKYGESKGWMELQICHRDTDGQDIFNSSKLHPGHPKKQILYEMGGPERSVNAMPWGAGRKLMMCK